MHRSITSEQRSQMLKSGLFDPDWYDSNYPDVKMSGIDPLEHFVSYGARLGRKGTQAGKPVGEDWSLEAWLNSNEARPASPASDFSGRHTSEKKRSILLVSGEPLDRPGALYRIYRMAESFRACGYKTHIFARDEVRQAAGVLKDAAMLYVWRAKWVDISALCREARARGVPYVFDVDDLMVRPDLATAQYIDAIRYNKHDEASVKQHYSQIREAMAQADYCTASTRELAWHMRRHERRRPTFVIPNTYDVNTYKKSRVAVRARTASKSDGKIRIGYASGSRTHQADFRLCSKAVAEILHRHPKTLLVLFRRNTLVTLDLSEFPEFDGLEDRIEWREFVRLSDLPQEVARFDINLAPLEVGNPFCESKSELKYFEAAIADVPTIASPTGPYKLAIEHNRTGFLAESEHDWFAAIESLIAKPALRKKIAREAHRAALWDFGPTRRAELVASLLDHTQSHRRATRAMHFEQHIQTRRPRVVDLVPHRVITSHGKNSGSSVTVVVPLYNYQNYIVECLNSVRLQTMPDLDLIIVDDHSTDNSGDIAKNWINEHFKRFNSVKLVQHVKNSGLGNARNTGFDLADTLYVMVLDADNRLLPSCCKELHQAANSSKSSFAYSIIQQFGDSNARMGTKAVFPADFIPGNVIDAMALVSKEAWSLVGGYASHRMGWQDYDLWCRFVDAGLPWEHVPSVLCEYRVHGKSMLRTATDHHKNKAKLILQMESEYSWISPLDAREGHRVSAKDMADAEPTE